MLARSNALDASDKSMAASIFAVDVVLCWWYLEVCSVATNFGEG